MMQVAMQLGLHRPSHSQDFSKFRVELIEEELRDKVRTWAVCNIVAQRYGYFPFSSTIFLTHFLGLQLDMASHRLPCMIGHYHRAIRWIPISSCLKTFDLGWR